MYFVKCALRAAPSRRLSHHHENLNMKFCRFSFLFSLLFFKKGTLRCVFFTTYYTYAIPLNLNHKRRGAYEMHFYCKQHVYIHSHYDLMTECVTSHIVSAAFILSKTILTTIDASRLFNTKNIHMKRCSLKVRNVLKSLTGYWH